MGLHDEALEAFMHERECMRDTKLTYVPIGSSKTRHHNSGREIRRAVERFKRKEAKQLQQLMQVRKGFTS